MSDQYHLKSANNLDRARSLGIEFKGKPGHYNAITDVTGIGVGYETLIEGSSIRTGVTAILPRKLDSLASPVFAAYHSLNGNGELTGSHWLEETGQLLGPITITNTHSCGLARDATIAWMKQNLSGTADWLLPVAAETYDGYLNDIDAQHISREHVFTAIENANLAHGHLAEGSVGGGTGMICYGYKGGSGTSSRIVNYAEQDYTLGAFVQANFGQRHQLTIDGIPVGRHLNPKSVPGEEMRNDERGSIIVVLATDAPLLPHQLKRLAKRAGLGIGRSGAIAGHGSGDIFLALSTANSPPAQPPMFTTTNEAVGRANFIPDHDLDRFFEAVIQSVDEAILNSLTANTSMTGLKNRNIECLPNDEVSALIKRYAVLKN